MAPKRPSPLDDPPAASSSEDEEATTEGEEEEEEDEDEEEASGSESEEEEDGEAKTPALPSNHASVKKPPSKKDEPAATATATAANSKPHPSPSGSDTESDSGSDTEPDDLRRPTANSNVKPIASKPMEETPPAKKPRSKSNAAPSAAAAAKLPAKRAGGESEAKYSKRAKKGVESEDDDEPVTATVAEQKKPAGDEKKLFQRLWSEDDEIVILKGMIEYATKKGVDPFADMNAFHDFIKKSLQINVETNKLVEKVKRMKKKYLNNARKEKKFNKPHEVEAFELSKKIWGEETNGKGNEAKSPKSNGKVKTNQKNSRPLALLKAELHSTPEPPKEVQKMDVDGNPGVSSSSSSNDLFDKYGESFSVGLPKHVVKTGLDLVSESKKAELVEKWKKLHMTELEVYAKRTELISEQTKLILDAYNQTNN